MADRQENGRFTPGHTLGFGGRPTKDKEKAAMQALSNIVTPEQAASIVKDLMFDPTSWRARQAGLEMYYYYLMGKPIQRTQTIDNDSMTEFTDSLAEIILEKEKAATNGNHDNI